MIDLKSFKKNSYFQIVLYINYNDTLLLKCSLRKYETLVKIIIQVFHFSNVRNKDLIVTVCKS